ncbi:MAG: NAD(P)-dependent oxidoreductase [Methanopyri archaeon]|nr:NAD(P)-dependent oxidoreductase [Methanopyri archaeon]
MGDSAQFKEMEKGFDVHQAVAEANRCLLCHDPPCSRGCPGGTDPGTFIRKLRLRNITGAIRTIKQNNILGGSCSVLCPTARLCEGECCATDIDRPIQIGRIQRFLVEQSWTQDINTFEKGEARAGKVAIVGSGPAGLSCAAEVSKEGYQVTVFESRSEVGGVLRYGVPSHRLSTTILENDLRALRDLGVEFRCDSPIQGEGAAEDLLNQGFDAVFLAPGLWKPIRLKEEDIGGVFTATDFLSSMREKKLDGLTQFFSGKDVAVIGGGSVAIDCVESALELGARDVYLVYRRSFTQMPAEEDETLSALRAGIHFLLLNQPVDYVTENGTVKGIRIARTQLGEKDASGRRRPVEIPDSEWVLAIDAVIEAIGSRAESDSPQWYPSVKVNSKNLVEVNAETGETSARGIFAGGDIINGPALVIDAIRDGKVAATAIKSYLETLEVSE